MAEKQQNSLTRYQRERYTNLFMEFDADNSGSISTKELKYVLKACGLSIDDEQVEDLINEADADGSGEVEIDEFLALINKELNNQYWSSEDFQASFYLFQTAEKNSIDADELRRLMRLLGYSISQVQAEEMVKFADKDFDGAISFQEYCEVMK